MKLYKFKSLDNMAHVLDIVLNNRLYCPEYRSLNDPFEGLFTKFMKVALGNGGDEVYQKKVHSVDGLIEKSKYERVCSLTRDLHDVKLWSHYAGGHTGIAIEIDFSDRFSTDATEVRYVDRLVREQDLALMGEEVTSRNILSVKTDHWSYESEYRIITDDEYYDIEGRISNIYCGTNISSLHKDILEKLLSQSGIGLIDTDIDPLTIKIVPA